MSSTTKVLFLGATGYIGGSIVDALLKHPDGNKYEIIAYARSAERAKQIEEFGLKAVSGEPSVIAEFASDSPVVINCASDDLPIIEAILDGAKKYFTKTQTPPIFIHSSGSGFLGDNALGQYASDKVYDDADGETINSIPADRWHRQADIAITKAHSEGYVRAYIVSPSLVYGLATGKLVEAGLQNPIPTALSIAAKSSVPRGQQVLLGPQLNRWSIVELNEIVELYLLVLKRALQGTRDADETNRYYFGVHGDVVAGDFFKKIAQALYEFGLLKTPETREYSKEELEQMPRGMIAIFGANTRASASRGHAIGWAPKHTVQDLLDGIRGSVEAYVKQQQTSAGTA